MLASILLDPTRNCSNVEAKHVNISKSFTSNTLKRIEVIQRKPRNKFETKIYKQLKRRRIQFRYEAEKFAYVLACHYTPDFIITTKTGKVYIETKGYLRPEHKRTLRAVKKQHPEIDIRILFYSINKRWIKWAERHGFVYAIGEVPKEWLDGF